MVRVRFAPSPTGNLHIGTLRTALFNWLFAKANKGVFVLRIEDTDLERSRSEYETNILQGLKWFGITIDEGPNAGGLLGPYRQSERIKDGTYTQYAMQLIKEKKAYFCFCTDEELNKEREFAKSKNVPYVYSRKALKLTQKEVEQKLADKQPYTIRFKMPDNEEIKFNDQIRGEISFKSELISDFVIIKSDGSPSYNFAAVIDDMLMEITHIIRGEDHISNTPRQIAIYNSLGKSRPEFAHMPMILGPDRSKLSKRHGATSITDYRDTGLLNQACFNYLSLLGWSPEDNQEFFTREELAEKFKISRIGKSNAIFDIKKLHWMNGQYIRKLSPGELKDSVYPFISDKHKEQLNKYDLNIQESLIYSVKDNLVTLQDINDYIAVYFETDEKYMSNLETFDKEKLQNDKAVIESFINNIEPLNNNLKVADIDQALNKVMAVTGNGKGKVYKPIRIATSAQNSGPHITDLLSIFGKEKLEKRLTNFLDYIR
ncbi:glutamate--tRNA ligase [Candidatus Marinamargulisbacteria bacterium SCGC AG-410-N11]|nr:glutamate--tRNA ligase [Candidatus Marinamargulisbacteria bacterium SCGC AG-410-N11]